jgi:hypothetical protein
MNELVLALPDLATQINEEHRQCLQAANATLEHARRAGELLEQAKAQLDHGQWLPWLKEHFPFSERMAQNYMRVAREWPRLEANPQRVADLSFRDALKLLVHSREDEYPQWGQWLDPDDPRRAIWMEAYDLFMQCNRVMGNPNARTEELVAVCKTMFEVVFTIGALRLSDMRIWGQVANTMSSEDWSRLNKKTRAFAKKCVRMAAVPEHKYKAYLDRTLKRQLDGPTEQEFLCRVVKPHEREQKRQKNEELCGRRIGGVARPSCDRDRGLYAV